MSCEPLDATLQAETLTLVELDHLVAAPRCLTTREHDFGCALHRHERAGVAFPEHRVVSAARCERQTCDLVPALRTELGAELEGSGTVDDGLVGRVRQLAPACRRRRAQSRREDEATRALDRGHRLRDVPVGHGPQLEAPFGEGAGLVEAEDVSAPQRLQDFLGIENECSPAKSYARDSPSSNERPQASDPGAARSWQVFRATSSSIPWRSTARETSAWRRW